MQREHGIRNYNVIVFAYKKCKDLGKENTRTHTQLVFRAKCRVYISCGSNEYFNRIFDVTQIVSVTAYIWIPPVPDLKDESAHRFRTFRYSK